MRLLARADASASGGFGHAVRTLAVVSQALARGHEVLFVGDLPPGWISDELERLGVPRRPAPADWRALAAAAREWSADAVHLDDYTAPDDVRTWVNGAGAVLANVEDGPWGRRPADVVLDQTWGSERTGRPSDGSTALLRGVEHVLVRPVVRQARLRRSARGARPVSDRLDLLVVMGGSDAAGVLGRAVAAVASTGLPAAVHAVASATDDLAALRALSTGVVEVRATGPTPDLPTLMADSDVVVSAAGTTASELSCIGTPAALVAVVDNQQQVLSAMVEAGVVLGLGGPDDLPAAGPALAALLRSEDRRHRLSEAAVAAVDGCGTARLLGAVEGLLADGAARGTRAIALHARPALPADAGLLLRWRNDEVVRGASRQQGTVDPEGHARWLAAVLADPDRWLLLVEDSADTPAATVRWDLDVEPDRDGAAARDAWEVSITLAPDQRGRRLSGDVLLEAEGWLAEREPAATSAIASVHVRNAASQALFRRAGYALSRPADQDGFERFSRPLRRRPR